MELQSNEKDSILGIENTMESKHAHHEIEEEVASLLLDIRDRCDNTDQYETSPKRKTNELYERDFLLLKKRKINRETSRHSDDDNNDEEYKEPEQHNDDDDYYQEEDDDDEWMENRNNPLGVRTEAGPRIPRKKAPSGTACEKHKRWKKRCPDDCPMRKAKSRRSGKMTRSQSMELKYDYYQDYEEQGSPLSTGEAETFSELSEDKSLYSRRSYETSPVAPRRADDIYTENRPSKSDLFSLISWSMQQLAQENNSNLTQDDIFVIQAQISKKTNLAMNGEESYEQIGDILETCKQIASSPAHVITIGPNKQSAKRGATRKYEQPLYYDNSSSLSPSSSMEDLSPGSFTTEEDIYTNQILAKYELEIPKSPRIQLKNLANSDSKKSPKTPRAKGTRKYLPQACERHKLLHAKCPANCPDRLKRDAERTPLSL